jgi:hypothetical protein
MEIKDEMSEHDIILGMLSGKIPIGTKYKSRPENAYTKIKPVIILTNGEHEIKKTVFTGGFMKTEYILKPPKSGNFKIMNK